MSTLDEILSAMEGSPRDTEIAATLARDAGNLLRPSDEEAVAGLIRGLAVRRRRLGWSERDDRAFEAGVLFALQEVLGAAAAAQRADRSRDRRAEAEQPLASWVFKALREQPLRPSELSRKLNVDGTRISRALRTLEREGAIYRQELEPGEDRRTRRYAVAPTTDAPGTTPEPVVPVPTGRDTDRAADIDRFRGDVFKPGPNKTVADATGQQQENVLPAKELVPVAF